MLISKYFVYFIIYSFLGWIYESCFCTVKDHYWQNRGFLYGPIVPIYGVGAAVGSIVFYELPFEELHNATILQIFIFSYLGSVVLEYTTSYTLEKLFHAKWWDYSDVPLNIKGRVCVPCSFGFGVGGVIIVKYIIPFVQGLTAGAHPMLFELLALVFMFIFGMDMALTVSSLTSFAKEFEKLNEQINSTISEKYATLDTSVSGAVNGAKTAYQEKVGEAKLAYQEKIDEAKLAYQEKLEEYNEKKEEREAAALAKKELNAEKWEEIKEQISAEALTKFIAQATETQRGQLRHIKTFTHPVQSTRSLMTKGASILRNKNNKTESN